MDDLMQVWDDVAPFVAGIGIVYIAGAVVSLVLVVAVFVFVFKMMRDMDKRFDEDWRK